MILYLPPVQNEGNQMFTITLDPIIAHLGPFVIRWYSLILLTATFVGLWITAREAERRGFNKEEIFDVAIWIIVGGLIGARLFHVLDHRPGSCSVHLGRWCGDGRHGDDGRHDGHTYWLGYSAGYSGSCGPGWVSGFLCLTIFLEWEAL